jgi:hypothetical protein
MSLAYLDLMIWRGGRYLIAWCGGILLRGVGGGFCGEAGDVGLRDYGCAVLGAGGGVGGGVGFVGDDSVKRSLGSLIALPIDFELAEIMPGSLHCASRRFRRSEREEKASARSGRDDSFYFRGADRFGQGSMEFNARASWGAAVLRPHERLRERLWQDAVAGRGEPRPYKGIIVVRLNSPMGRAAQAVTGMGAAR